MSGSLDVRLFLVKEYCGSISLPEEEKQRKENHVAREKWHQRTSMQRTMFDTFAYILHVLSMVIISSQMFPGGVSLRVILNNSF